ncbi:MAG: phosphoribosylanthranilate isomerase [Proteobacteria bacterium]|nr:phosphoribosylanthranilate isomerase [Pseudomonadota bacterium]MBU3980669.1 phosphoribosylanthranilate isomerase [Pseudomonadota bacterium]
MKPLQNSKIHNCPQVKVCGLTRVEEAVGCADLGANAIGCVFFPKSPRHLSEIQAKEISMALPSEVKKVGVFVNESFPNIMHKVEFCRLNAVQLHGRESPELVSKLLKENLLVIKALFIEGKPTLDEAETYEASAFLVECGRGVLPGGNAIEWDWKKVKSFGNKYPMILAGGLAPENISHAVSVSMPDAVDVSSGVESAPGQKDLGKVKSFLKAVSMCELKKTLRKIF